MGQAVRSDRTKLQNALILGGAATAAAARKRDVDPALISGVGKGVFYTALETNPSRFLEFPEKIPRPAFSQCLVSGYDTGVWRWRYYKMGYRLSSPVNAQPEKVTL